VAFLKKKHGHVPGTLIFLVHAPFYALGTRLDCADLFNRLPIEETALILKHADLWALSIMGFGQKQIPVSENRQWPVSKFSRMIPFEKGLCRFPLLGKWVKTRIIFFNNMD
jgi:hypothetical protein